MKTDSLGRRSRSARPAPFKGRIKLSPIDVTLFEKIRLHGPLPTHFLYEFVKDGRKNYTGFQKRLTRLYNGNENGPYFVKPPRQFDAYEARYQSLIYNLAPRALGLLPENRFGAPPGWFLHQLMTACVGASFDLLSEARGLRYISRSEILADMPVKTGTDPMALPVGASTLVPDDLFALQFPDGWRRYCAVEIDRNTETTQTMLSKVSQYVRAFETKCYKGWWGIPNLGVLIVTTRASRVAKLLGELGEPAGRFANRFAFQVVPEFDSDRDCDTDYWRIPKGVLTNLLDKPWQTVAGEKDIGAA